MLDDVRVSSLPGSQTAGALNNVETQPHVWLSAMRKRTHYRTQDDGTIKWVNTSWKSIGGLTSMALAPPPGLLERSPAGQDVWVRFNKSWTKHERFIAGFMRTWGL